MTDRLDAKSKQLKTVPISNLSLKDVERCLKLELDVMDTEIKDVQPLPLSPHLGAQSKTWIRRDISLIDYSDYTRYDRNSVRSL